MGKSESRFRTVNEGIDAGRGLSDASHPVQFVCECGQLGCTEVIELTITEYEQVRRSGRRFVVVPGHVNPEVERVVVEAGDHVVVEKFGEAADAAEASDPRTSRDQD